MHAPLRQPSPREGGALSVLEYPFDLRRAMALPLGRRHVPAPCALVLAAGDDPIGILGRLLVGLRHVPWAIPGAILSGETGDLASLVSLFPELRHRIAVIRRRRADPTPDALAGAVRRRPVPTPETLADYIVRRTARFSLHRPLTEQFALVLRPRRDTRSRSVASFSRRFAREGPYTARDWRRVAWLAWAVGAGDEHERLQTIEPLGGVARVRAARRYLGLSWKDAVRHPGWEWVLERALRLGRYPTS